MNMTKNNYYFIGIGGISMSALARLLLNEGHYVAGSDITESKLTEDLQSEGIKVNYQANLEDISIADIVVVNSAISENNEELCEAKRLHKIVVGRGELLGLIAKKYKNVIAISGAHGKTTTTALIASIFRKAGVNPTVHIGGVLTGDNSNLILGDKDYFITEACEYKDNFLYLKPTFGVVLNVEPEHLDYFKCFEGVKRSFRQFITQCEYSLAPVEFGGNKLNYSAHNVSQDENGLHFDCYHDNDFYAKLDCKIYGLHNVQNLLTAVQVANYFNIAKDAVIDGLAEYRGVKRRYEIYKLGKGKLIFDYAHHPTEIKKSILTTQNFCQGRLIVVFQPHTYSRTKMLFHDFVEAFDCGLDKAIIFKTYSAREKYDAVGDAKRLFNDLKDKIDCEYSEDYRLLEKLKLILKDNDIVLVLGAGDFYDKVDFNIFD